MVVWGEVVDEEDVEEFGDWAGGWEDVETLDGSDAVEVSCRRIRVKGPRLPSSASDIGCSKGH